MRIKTIDIQAKEWRDNINGNTYYSARVTLNYGIANEKRYYIPFQYGNAYGMAEPEILTILINDGLADNTKYSSFRKWITEEKIIKREFTEKNCRQRDVKAWGRV
jgi:hypothetical protein